MNNQCENIITAGSITIHTNEWLVYVDDTPVNLTYIEYLLLKTLMQEQGRVITREALLERVWAYGNVNMLETRTVDVHLGRLRKKLGRAANLIVTVRNVGYRMAFSPEWVVK